MSHTYISKHGDNSPYRLLSLIAELYCEHNGYDKDKRDIEILENGSGFKIITEIEGETCNTFVGWHNVWRYHIMNWDKFVMVNGGGDEYGKVIERK